MEQRIGSEWAGWMEYHGISSHGVYLDENDVHQGGNKFWQ